jgi:hypothetical protein
MRERVDLKSPVRENRPPGSVRGAPGNRCPYRDSSRKLFKFKLQRSGSICPGPRANKRSDICRAQS